jgi:hypothetical protein
MEMRGVWRSATRNSRFQTEDVADQLAFVPLVVTHLPRLVEKIHAGHPLLDRELVFPRKIMNMLNQGRHNLAHPRTGFWTDGFDDILREVGIEGGSVVGALKAESWMM